MQASQLLVIAEDKYKQIEKAYKIVLSELSKTRKLLRSNIRDENLDLVVEIQRLNLEKYHLM